MTPTARTAKGSRRRSPSRWRRGAGSLPGRRWFRLPQFLALLAVVVVGLLAVVLLTRESGSESSGGGPGLAGQRVEQFMHVHGLAIAPWSSEVVWLSTHQGLVLIDGDEWRYVSEEPHDFMGFAVHPQKEDVLYTSGHPSPRSGLENPLGLMVSTDAGRTWETRSLQGEVDFHALAVHHADGEVLYGYDATDGQLLRSDDGGRHWQSRAVPHPGGVLALAVHPTDPDTVLAGTPGGLFMSSDAAETWQVLLDEVPVTAIAYDAGVAERVLAYVAGPGGDGMVATEDAGQSWHALGLELDEDAISHIAVHPTAEDVIYVGSIEGSVHRTVDGGRRWDPLAVNGMPVSEEE
jgi:hypothetical protein